MAIASVNPMNEQVLKEFEELTLREIDTKIENGAKAFDYYRKTAISDRAVWMNAAADLLEKEKVQWANLMVLEMGKPKAAAVAEAEKCAWACRYYADNAEAFLAPEPVQTDALHSELRFMPLGPVLAVMPWNFPFWQVFRFAAPALMAGNVGLLKHASNVPQCALAIEEIFARSGFPDGVFQTLLIGADKVEHVLNNDRVVAATLTGSETAGAKVAGLAGAAIKKTVMELGGSDPFIVMPSADVDVAAKTAVTARTINNGQSCIAAKRFIIHQDIYDGFERKFVDRLEALTVGDPMADETDIGPLATPQILEEVDTLVQASIDAGAKLLSGGRRGPKPGYFYIPTALTDIPKDAPVYGEEVFGPVAMLFKVSDLEEAIALANDSNFGLGSSAWTSDESEQRRIIEDIESGQVFINAMVASDPRLPFGGVKRSGYGRELGAFGVREFVNVKTVYIGKA